MSAARLFCFAHRGASGQEPENTLRAIRRALEIGAPGIEIDVWRAVDGLAVIHDRRLDRTTNGTGFLESMRMEELRRLDAGKGEGVPSLREVLDTVDRRAVLNVELKGGRTAEAVAELIGEYVGDRSWRVVDFLVSSFDHAELGRFRVLRPEIPTGFLLETVPESLAAGAEKFGAVSVHVPLDKVTPRLVDDAHGRGLKVFVFTVNEPADIRRMEELGVDGVFSDHPERIVGV